MNDIELIKSELNAALPGLGKHRIEELRRVIDRHYQKRFKGKRRLPKYGSLNKGFTEQQLEAFMHAIESDKFRLLFAYQAKLGLRVGEVCKLREADINRATRELLVHTEKARTIDTLIIPDSLFASTLAYMEAYKPEINAHKGYLFFTKTEQSRAGNVHVDENYVRNKFRYYVIEAGLDETYGTSEEQAGRSVRSLHRLTTHSLRHYAITRFARACNGNLVLTSRFARHREPGVTMTYINTDKTELYGVIERAMG